MSGTNTKRRRVFLLSSNERVVDRNKTNDTLTMKVDELHTENIDERAQINQDSVYFVTVKAEEVNQESENYGIDVPLVHLEADEPYYSMAVSCHLVYKNPKSGLSLKCC